MRLGRNVVSTARFGIPPNYSEFAPDGTLTYYGDATVWLDKNFSGASLDIGNSAPDLIQVAGGTMRRRAFDGVNTVEQLFGDIEIPHGWQPGSVYAHVHWQPVNGNVGSVKWQVTYVYAADDEVDSAEATTSLIQAAPGLAWQHTFAALPVIDLGTDRPIGTQLGFRLFRDPTDGDDDYGSDAMLITFGVHVEMRRLGSRQIGTY